MASATDAENNAAYSNITLLINPLQVQPLVPPCCQDRQQHCPSSHKLPSTIAY
jgi:hypothetical protein